MRWPETTRQETQLDAPESNPLLAEAERYVREGEEPVARQLTLVNTLDAAGRHEEAKMARVLLAILTDTLNAAQRRFHIEQMAQRRRQGC